MARCLKDKAVSHIENDVELKWIEDELVAIVKIVDKVRLGASRVKVFKIINVNPKKHNIEVGKTYLACNKYLFLPK